MLNKRKINYKILFVFLLVLTTLVAVLTVKIYPSLRFLVVIPLSMFLGFSFPHIFKKVIPVKNILTYFVLSLFYGLFLNSLMIFCLGLLGVSITSNFFLFYIPSVLLLNVLFYVFCIPKEEIEKCFLNTKLRIVDLIWFGIYFLSFIFFLQICTERFFPNWDNFTYWAIDAKYIFESGSLHGKSLDILEKFYLPLYPLQLSYVYFLYGRVVEQFSSLLTLLYGYIGLFVLGGYIADSKRDLVMKNLLYFLSLTALVSFFYSLNTLVTQYADVFCAILLLFYGIVVFSQKVGKDTFFLRLILVILFSSSLYLTKLAYAPVSLLMIILYLLYDAHFLLSVFKGLKKNTRVILWISLFFFVFLGVYIIFKTPFGKNITNYTVIFKDFYLFTKERFEYLVKILQYLLRRIPEFLLAVFLLFGGYVFYNKGIKKTDSKKILITLILSVIPILLYFVLMKSTKNGSFLRYMSLVLFLISYLLILLTKDIKFNGMRTFVLSTVVLIPVVFSMFFRIHIEYGFNWEFMPNSGEYRDSKLLRESYLISEEIRSKIKPDDKIMFVGQEQGENMGNIAPPNLYIRYYLAENSVGSQYSIPVKKWIDYMYDHNPDYVFITNYSGFFPKCDKYLEEGSFYLLEIQNQDKEHSEEECFFDSKDLFKIELDN